MSNNSPTRTKPGDHEEPELTQEESVPSDGKDIEGEAMMKSVHNKKLVNPDAPEDEPAD
ncbi:hypothetical protein WKW80_24205 [Variovorax humicola]|uniref:Uncharacterized protein n=1 Tax=Variovorax humicola TaxID=1769758 RepID=A0ABU8W6C3_9BURK